MLHAVSDPTLDEILSSVSRSFYLSLAILPRVLRTQLSAAYLVARAGDTIADTRAVRSERRRELLAELRAALRDESRAERLAADLRREVADSGPHSVAAEQRLLYRFSDCVALLHRQSDGDRDRTSHVLEALITGMERDLVRFADGQPPRALASMEELDEHTYLAAGCVGEYWSLMTAAHLPAVSHLNTPDRVKRAVRLGKALQLVNVIRDAPRDLAAGRCYFPEPLLARHGLAPADLVGPERRHARPAVEELRMMAIEHVDAAWPYVMSIPASAPRLRLACLWPLWIGLGTLERIARSPDPLDPAVRIKLPRSELYRVVAESIAVVSINPILARSHWRRRARAARKELVPAS